MRASRIGQALLTLGVVVGVGAAVAWFIGFDPTTLPPAILKIAAYKLTALAAVGLMAAGAMALRFGRQIEKDRAKHVERREQFGLSGDEMSKLEEKALLRAKSEAERKR